MHPSFSDSYRQVWLGNVSSYCSCFPTNPWTTYYFQKTWSVPSSNWVTTHPQKMLENLKQLNVTGCNTLKLAAMCLPREMQCTCNVHANCTFTCNVNANLHFTEFKEKPPQLFFWPLPCIHQDKCLVAASTSCHALKYTEHKTSRMGAGCIIPDFLDSTSY